MKIAELFEGKMKQETAEAAWMRYNSLKKSNADPTMLAKVLALATSKMTDKFNATKRDFETRFGGEGWWEDVKKLYKIKEQDNKWVVISNAVDWKQTRDWEFDTQYEAIAQLEKLIGYKLADRKKGVGSVDKDYERLDKLASKS